MPYTMTLRRRRADGSLEELVLECEVTKSTIEDGALTDTEITELILDTELQANGTMLQTPRPPVRMWLNERS